MNLNFTMVKQNVLDYPKIGSLSQSLRMTYTIITDLTTHNRDIAFADR